MSKKTRVVVAVSGRGRSLLNLKEKEKTYGNYTVCGVISSARGCQANLLARDLKLPLFFYPDSKAQSEPQLKDSLSNWLDSLDCQWLLLAGYLKKFPLQFKSQKAWTRQLLNIHPSLLPDFGGAGMYGRRVHEAVLKAGASQSGASVHLLSSDYDKGPLLAQVRCKLQEQLSSQELAEKVFALEKKLYPFVLSQVIEKKLPLAYGKVLSLSEEELEKKLKD